MAESVHPRNGLCQWKALACPYLNNDESVKMEHQVTAVEALRDRVTRDIHAALGLSGAKWSYHPLKFLL